MIKGIPKVIALFNFKLTDLRHNKLSEQHAGKLRFMEIMINRLN